MVNYFSASILLLLSVVIPSAAGTLVITTNADLISEINAWVGGNTNGRGDINTWDVSGLTDFSNAFSGQGSFNDDISNWDVSSALTMTAMFRDASTFNGDISNWDVSKVTDTSYMFRGASSFNRDISSWDVSSVVDASFMFSYATVFNRDLCAWEYKLEPYTVITPGSDETASSAYLQYPSVTSMFELTSCENTNDPEFLKNPGGPFCHECPFEPPGPGICFSSQVEVNVLSKGKVTMDNVEVGDEVLTGSGEFKPVYMINHFHPTKPTEFIQIHSILDKEEPLEVTDHHMVFVDNYEYPVPASHVKVGDNVHTIDGPKVVTAINRITRKGLYNPITTDGTIVANGLLASTYTSYSGETHIKVGGSKLLPMQALEGFASTPYGVFCTSFLGSVCNQHDEYAGVSMAMRQLYNFWSKQNEFLKLTMFLGYLFVFGCLNVLARCGNIILALGVVWMGWNVINKKKKFA